MNMKIGAAVALLAMTAACQSIAQQALKSDEAVDIAANTEFNVTSTGIYRISHDWKGDTRLLALCPTDTQQQLAFQKLVRFERASPGTITDEDPFDYFAMSINPITTEENFDDLTAEIGIEIKGVPHFKRVAEKYTVSGEQRSIPAEDALLDAAFVEGAVKETCKGHLADAAGFSARGKPVYVYEIAKAGKLYSKLVGMPTVKLEAAKGDAKVGNVELEFGTGIVTDRASNAVFGIRYFGVGPFKDRPVPTTKF